MFYPTRKKTVAVESIEEEVLSVDEGVVESTLPEPEAEVNELAELVRADNVIIHDSKLTASELMLTDGDLDTVNRVVTIANESLAKGGLTYKNATALNQVVNHIASRYGIKTTAIGMENFLYPETTVAATEALGDKAAQVSKRLLGAIGGAASQLADNLIKSIKHLTLRSTTLKTKIDAYKYKVSNLNEIQSIKVPMIDSVAKLRVNGVPDLKACIALADKEMNIKSMATSWKGLWSRGGSRGVIYKADFQIGTSGFIEPVVEPASSEAIRALPKRLKQSTPVNVSALPGDVFVTTIKDENGLVSSGWNEGLLPVESETYLPAVETRAEALKILEAASKLATILNTDLKGFISASDQVESAALELAKAKDGYQPSKAEVRQAKANLDAAYVFQHAIIRSVWNVTEGLFMYVKKSLGPI